MQLSHDSTYRHVQGLSRGLSILRALNDADCGGATPGELSTKIKLNRTTVKRLLETLAEEGYVRSCDCEGRYGLAPEVLTLSRGVTREAHVLSHAAPVLKQLGRQTGWSLRISTLQDDHMVIRDSTHPGSKLAFEAWGGLRGSLPILLTAAGRAFFAHCSEPQRDSIVDEIRRQRSEQTSLANNGKLIEQLTRRVLDDGYAVNDGDWGERRLGAVAVPVRSREGRVIASMSLLYTRRAVSKADISDEFVPALRQSAKDVEARL